MTTTPAGPSRTWAVVGGGVLGMELAGRLRAAGHAVTLVEAGPAVGGMTESCAVGGVVWDRFYHVILMSDLRLRKLLAELKLEDDVAWTTTKTGFYTDGKLYSMSNVWEFLRFPPLWLIDKVRLGFTIWYASKLKDPGRLEKIPVVDWLRRLSGRRTTEKIWLPLLRAKLGENYRRASAAFIWAIIARMYAARKTQVKTEMFGYVRGGYRRVTAAFAGKLAAAGVVVRVNSPVAAIEPAGGGFVLRFRDGLSQEFDRVVVTAANPVADVLIPDSPPANIPYQGVLCVSLVLKESLSPYYITNITDADVPFTAVIGMSNIVDAAAEFGGRHLVYLPKYLDPADAIFAEPDASVVARFAAALQKMYPAFGPAAVVASGVSRLKYVLPIPTLDYSAAVPPMRTSTPGLYRVNSSQIVNGTLNVNETLLLADRGAAVLLAD